MTPSNTRLERKAQHELKLGRLQKEKFAFFEKEVLKKLDKG